MAINKLYSSFGMEVAYYDGWNLIAEYRWEEVESPIPEEESYFEWAIHCRFTWGLDLSGSPQGAGGVGGLLAFDKWGTKYYPTFDGNGNISEYLDSSGVRAAHFEYDAFGNVVASSEQSTGLAAIFRFRFSTKMLDEETGLYYYGYRFYDPVTGRWPSRDPIEERGGLSLYQFSGNDGVNDIDYLGLVENEKKFEYELIPEEKGKTMGVCGGFKLNILWKVKGAEKTFGTIIQRIDKKVWRTDCKTGIEELILVESFFEAWAWNPTKPLQKGDTWAVPNGPPKCKGRIEISGHAYFVAADPVGFKKAGQQPVLEGIPNDPKTTGDDGTFSADFRGPKWSNIDLKEKGFDTKEDGYDEVTKNNPVASAVKSRVLKVKFDCCNGEAPTEEYKDKP